MATTLAASCSSPPLLRPMSLLPRLRVGLSLPLRRRRALTAVAAAVRQDAATWTQAPLSLVAPASADASLFHVSVDVSYAPDLAVSYTVPGQYLQLRVPASDKPSFLAIASPPSFASSRGEFQFLVKRVPGSTADLLCGLGRGDVVELSAVMGKGFQVERISPPDAFPAVLIFATGSGISPIRSLIESGFNANERSDVRLYYGARNLQRMAYQDRFKDWESTGVRVIPVLSQPDEKWSGERGYVQAAFSRTKEILNPLLTGAVLCGHKQMAEVSCSVGTKKRVAQCTRLPLFGDVNGCRLTPTIIEAISVLILDTLFHSCHLYPAWLVSVDSSVDHHVQPRKPTPSSLSRMDQDKFKFDGRNNLPDTLTLVINTKTIHFS
ncbi:fruit protein pKIWI502-like isoform X1 [Musa acuminata AAA Group]|uniref:fruit protein pKIWI502-like isoform X1 n=1 Tax=Musa acuminata AAA Group TaxID=214697 RepID=UPI0031DB1057